MGLVPSAAIDPWLICEHFDIGVLRLSEIDIDCSQFLTSERSPFSAVTVPCGPAIAIVHNDMHHPYRQRSNICHELAHCFLGHKAVPPLTEEGEKNHDGGIEAEANFLAGSLLITNEAAIFILKSGLSHQAQGIYGVSQPMLDYRLRVSGAMTRFRRSMVA